MASAERTYVDPSALRTLYIHEPRSTKFAAWRRRVGGSLPITRFGRSELVNSLELAVFRGSISRTIASAAFEDLDADLAEGRLVLVDMMWRRAIDAATDLSRRHTAVIGTRALDVLHVASALTLETTHFVSHDHRQIALSKAVGLKTLSP